MLNKEQIKLLADKLKLPFETMEAAITSTEEVTLEIPELHTFTGEELTTLKENIGKESATKGAATVMEMQIKELARTKFNADGVKSLDKLLEVHKDQLKAEFKPATDKEKQELMSSITKLQQEVTERDSKINQLASEKSQLNNEYKLRDVINSKVLSGLELPLPKEDVADILKMRVPAHFDENGNIYAMRDGQVVKDHLQNPIPYEKVASEFVTERYKPTKGDGRSDKDKFSQPKEGYLAAKSFAELNQYFEANKVPVDKQAVILGEVKKANPDFKF